MKTKQILYLLDIYTGNYCKFPDSPATVNAVTEELLAKELIQPNGFGFDITLKGKQCINQLLNCI